MRLVDGYIAGMAKDSTQIAIRVSARLLGELDTLTKKANERRSWPKLTRSGLIRAILEKTIERPSFILDGYDAE